MVDHNISIGENNKLEGSFNYQDWKIKAKTIYKRESLGGYLYKDQYYNFSIHSQWAQITEN
jgi:hypothetical protein